MDGRRTIFEFQVIERDFGQAFATNDLNTVLEREVIWNDETKRSRLAAENRFSLALDRGGRSASDLSTGPGSTKIVSANHMITPSSLGAGNARRSSVP